jgi:peptidyl-prolyl cis-trans isomerase C
MTKGHKMRILLSKSILLLLAAVFLAFSGLNCGKKSSEPAETNQPQPAQTKIEADTKTDTEAGTASAQTPTAEEPADQVAVTVNGFEITEQTLQKALQPELARMNQQNQKLPPQLQETLEKQLRQQILEQLIVVRLLEEKAKESNIEVTEEEVMNQIKQLLAAQQPPMSLDEYKKRAAQTGQSFEQIKEQIRKGLTYQKIVNSQWKGKVDVTEADAKQYFQENPQEFETEEQVQASHILIKPETGEDPNKAQEQAGAKAEDLLKQIKEGADFAELAKEHSDCPSAAKGGDLGYFGEGRMVPAFEKAAFALEVGQVSDLVKTRFGYHIIKLTDRKEAGTTSFEQAKEDLIQKLSREKRIELANNYIESLKEAANIVYPPGKEPSSSPTAPMIPQPQ